MKKIIIIPLIMLLCITSVIGLDICADNKEIVSPCLMLIPSISCSNYTYNITRIVNATIGDTVTNGNLTTFTGTTYSFNFTEDVGDYLVTLCDESTREISVIGNTEGKMLSTIIGLIVAIIFFIYFGLRVEKDGNHWVSLLLFFFASIEFILLLGSMYAYSANIDFTEMLKINFWTIGTVMITFLLYLLTVNMLNMIDIKKTESGNNHIFKKKW